MINISLGIGITTKDRWDDLVITLSQLEQKGYSQFEVVVIDDGSVKPCPINVKERFSWVQFKDQGKVKGIISQRNRLAHILKSDYYLSLDDDSFPISGDICKAVEFLENNEKIVALGFVIEERNMPPIPSHCTAPYPIRYYIGCAHLLKRELFLRLQGYREQLIAFGEEPDFCVRAYIEGYFTYGFPEIVIKHNKTPVARNKARNSYFYMRNESLLGLLYFPFPFSLIRPLICLRKFGNREWNAHPKELFLGWISSFLAAWKWKYASTKFSVQEFLKWRSYPIGG